MNKIGSLRTALEAANPWVRTNPDRLVIFVDKGRLVSRLTPGLGWEWRYAVRMEFHDFTGSPDEIALPLVIWLREHQPDLFLDFTRDESALGFAADIIDASTWDIVFAFELTEAVTVATNPGGGWTVDRLPEPGVPGADSDFDALWLGDRLTP